MGRDVRITKEMFNEKLKEIKENQATVLEKIQRYTNADEKFYLTANTLLSLAKRAKELFVSSEVEEKRQLLNFLLQNLVLDGKNLKFELKTPFDRVLEANKCSDMCPHQDSNLNLRFRKPSSYPLNDGGEFNNNSEKKPSWQWYFTSHSGTMNPIIKIICQNRYET